MKVKFLKHQSYILNEEGKEKELISFDAGHIYEMSEASFHYWAALGCVVACDDVVEITVVDEPKEVEETVVEEVVTEKKTNNKKSKKVKHEHLDKDIL